MIVTASVESRRESVHRATPATPPGGTQEWRVQVTVQGPHVVDAMAVPHGLALVLDHGHFVSPAQWRALRQGVADGVQALSAQDYLALVVMDRQHRLLASPAQVGANREWVADRLAGVEPGEGANLCGAWLRARQQLEEAHWVVEQHAASSRCILLCTAGYPDTGVTDRAILVELVRGARHRGIRTTVLAVGDHPNQALLEAMADAGGGQCHAVRTAAEVAAAVAAERRRVGLRALRQVALRLVPSEGVRIEEIDGGDHRRDPGGSVAVAIGELLSEEERQVTLQLACPDASWERLLMAQAPLLVVHGDGERFTARGGTEFRAVLLPVHAPA